jgi:subtilase family serine protease
VGPDLFVYTVAMPLTATAGSSIAITDTVRNGGGEAAGPSATRFYLSRNSTLDAGDVPLAARDVPVVAANGSNSGTTTVVLPAGISGQHYIITVADGFGAVAESSETNNVMFRGLMIAAPASPEVGSGPGPAR